ncbi:MAG: hypothetical protein HY774_00715 [Acidobacteria bacterium]|nr:hypothetical protein [Acidobacteriota bacterium]
MTVYEHYLETGSGTVRVTLMLDADIAVVNYEIRIMGAGNRRFSLEGQRIVLAETYGYIKLRSFTDKNLNRTIEISSLGSIVGDPDWDDDMRDVFNHIFLEYYCVPGGAPYVADDPGYEQMREMNWANWNDRFDVLLVVHFCAMLHPEFADYMTDSEAVSELKSVLTSLNRQKLAIRREETLEPGSQP